MICSFVRLRAYSGMLLLQASGGMRLPTAPHHAYFFATFKWSAPPTPSSHSSVVLHQPLTVLT